MIEDKLTKDERIRLEALAQANQTHLHCGREERQLSTMYIRWHLTGSIACLGFAVVVMFFDREIAFLSCAASGAFSLLAIGCAAVAFVDLYERRSQR